MCQRMETIIFSISCDFRARLQNTQLWQQLSCQLVDFNAGLEIPSWWRPRRQIFGLRTSGRLAFAREAVVPMSRKNSINYHSRLGRFFHAEIFPVPAVSELDGIQLPRTKINSIEPSISSTGRYTSEFENSPRYTFAQFTRRRDVNRSECIPF